MKKRNQQQGWMEKVRIRRDYREGKGELRERHELKAITDWKRREQQYRWMEEVKEKEGNCRGKRGKQRRKLQKKEELKEKKLI